MASNGLTRATQEIVEVSFLHATKEFEVEKLSFKEAIDAQKPFAAATREFMSRMGIKGHGSKEGIMFFNGKLLEFNEDKVIYFFFVCMHFAHSLQPWVHTLMPHLAEQTRIVQKMVSA